MNDRQPYYLSIGLLLACLLLAAEPLGGQVQLPVEPRYAGTAEGDDLETARAAALRILSEQIQVSVSSTMKIEMEERDGSLRQSARATTIARSVLTLRDVAEVVERIGTRYKVTRSVTRASVDAVFNERRSRVRELVGHAEAELASTRPSVNVGLALKQLYWALLLAEISRDTIMITPAGGPTSTLATTWLPRTIEVVSKGVLITPTRRVRDEGTVWYCDARFSGRPVTGLQYEYFDGVGQTIGEVEDGRTIMTLFFQEDSTKERVCELLVEYRNREEMDDVLRYADSLVADRRLSTTIRVVFPTVGHSRAVSMPDAIQELARAGSDGESLLQCLSGLERRSRVVAGASHRFESLEGLYGLVVSAAGLERLLYFTGGQVIDARNGAPVDLTHHRDRRIIWVEVLDTR